MKKLEKKLGVKILNFKTSKWKIKILNQMKII